jgi:hypothetical protein
MILILEKYRSQKKKQELKAPHQISSISTPIMVSFLVILLLKTTTVLKMMNEIIRSKKQVSIYYSFLNGTILY